MAQSRLERLRARRTDALVKGLGINEAYARLAEDDAVKYAIGAMQPLDPNYTANTFAEADRVQEQLRSGLAQRGISADFRYQGSVTSDTHIRVHSDIDLLAIHGAFYSLEPPLTVTNPYLGNPIEDLRSMRQAAAQVLRGAFPAATVDPSRGKAIALSGGSLRRKIDVVIANWYTTVLYAQQQLEAHRAVHVYDAKTDSRIANKPFLHNQRIEDRDAGVGGGLKKTIRLLKSLKYDAEKGVSLSSYDIASIAYRMPDDHLGVGVGRELLLVANAERFLRMLIENPAVRTQLLVPNEMRAIFGPDSATEAGLRQLHAEVVRLMTDIREGLSRSFKKLEEARILY